MIPSLQILRSPIYLFMFGVILVSFLMIALFLWYMLNLRKKNAPPGGPLARARTALEELCPRVYDG